MAQAKKLVLPSEWRTFANRYGVDHAYWYVPKGLAVTVDALKRRLKVLKEFEAAGNSDHGGNLEADLARWQADGHA